MKNNIAVRIDDYIRYLNKYGSNKLDNKNEIYGIGSFPPKFIKTNEEIFNGTKNDYKILNKTNKSILIEFNSSLDNKYHIDLYKEPDNNIWYIGFSEFSNSPTDIHSYEILTNNKESIDVFSRIIWILKDLNLDVEYCIGATGNSKKDRIYEYMMRFVSNWEKKETEYYQPGWGIYFKI